MNELATLLEWLGMGLVGLLILVVVIMMAGLSKPPQDWE
jgi:hypothetical protein